MYALIYYFQAYLDTPGLADASKEIREAAAEAITQSFKLGDGQWSELMNLPFYIPLVSPYALKTLFERERKRRND